MSRHPGASHPNTPGSQHLGHGTPGSQHLGHNTPGSQHLGHGTPGSQHLGHGTPGSQHGSQQARSHHGPSSHHGSQVTRISFFGQNHLFYICSTDHCTVLSTGAATVSPRLGSLLQEPPTHPHITLQMQVILLLLNNSSYSSFTFHQTSPTILDSTCGEEVETGRTQDTPKATQAMIGAIRNKDPQDQAIQTPGPPTLNQGPQTGGERIGWAHQGHLGTSD